MDGIELNGQRFAYDGSGTVVDGGWGRVKTYEKAKRLANEGAITATTIKSNSRHLDTALLLGAIMHLRIIAAFDVDVTADMIVLIEGIFADFLQTLAAIEGQRKMYGQVIHSPAILEASKDACHPDRRGTVCIGLNNTSPSRQGTGQLPGSMWSNADLNMRSHEDHMRVRGSQEGCCTCGTQDSNMWYTSTLTLLPAYADKPMCNACVAYLQMIEPRGEQTVQDQRLMLATRQECIAKIDDFRNLKAEQDNLCACCNEEWKRARCIRGSTLFPEHPAFHMVYCNTCANHFGMTATKRFDKATKELSMEEATAVVDAGSNRGTRTSRFDEGKREREQQGGHCYCCNDLLEDSKTNRRASVLPTHTEWHGKWFCKCCYYMARRLASEKFGMTVKELSEDQARKLAEEMASNFRRE